MIPLQSQTIFISPPRSFNELNDRLKTCVEQESFHPLRLKEYSLEKKSKYLFNLDQVLSAMRFPIGIYTDVNKESISLWQRLMIQLFPIIKMNETERKTFALFCKNILMYATPPPQIDPRTLVKYPGLPDTFDPLPEFVKIYNMDTKERLELAMTDRHTPKNVEEKAKKLQVILCLLILEQDLLTPTLEASEIYQLFQHHKELYHKDHTVIPLNFFSDRVFFAEADLAGPEDPTNLPFFLQIQSTMKNVVSLVRLALNERSAVHHQALDDLIKKVENLNERAKTSHPHWSVQIERCLNLVKSELLGKDYGIKSLAQAQFFVDFKASLLFTDPKANFPAAEDIVYPITLWQIKKYHLIQSMTNELIYDPLESKPYGQVAINTDQEAVRKNCQTWYSLQEKQQALYREAYCNLQEMIKKHGLKSYTKKLFGKGDLPSELPLKILPGIEALTPNYQRFFAPSEIKRRAEPEEKKEKAPVIKPEKVEKPVSTPKEKTLPALLPRLPGKEPPLFDERVTRWHNHPVDKPLSREIFGERYASYQLEYQQRMIAYHSFSVLADRFYDFGTKGTWFNPTTKRIDTQYIIAAEMHRKNMQPERGMIILSVDPDGICYHKYFHQKVDADIIKTIIDEAFYLSDFPTLEESMKITRDKEKKTGQMSVEGETFEVDPVLGSVTITNPRLDLKITLYKSSSF